jgi:hypothetical protein
MIIAWKTDSSERLMLAFTPNSTFQLRLPPGNGNASSLNIVASIRDTLNSVTEFQMQSITVMLDSTAINALINVLQQPSNGATANPIIQLLAGGNQNTVGQLITSVSLVLNEMNSQIVQTAVAGKFCSIYSSDKTCFFRWCSCSNNFRIIARKWKHTNGELSNINLKTKPIHILIVLCAAKRVSSRRIQPRVEQTGKCARLSDILYKQSCDYRRGQYQITSIHYGTTHCRHQSAYTNNLRRKILFSPLLV